MDQFWLIYGDNRTIAEVTTLLKVTDNIAIVTAGTQVMDSWDENQQVGSVFTVSSQVAQLFPWRKLELSWGNVKFSKQKNVCACVRVRLWKCAFSVCNMGSFE